MITILRPVPQRVLWVHPTEETVATIVTLAVEDGRRIWSLMADPHSRQGLEAFIRDLPTIYQGHTDDLKLEWYTSVPPSVDSGDNSSHYRLWVSRMTIEDGAPGDHLICLEHRYTKGWRKDWGWRQFERKDSV